jgi:hypothetical protein
LSCRVGAAPSITESPIASNGIGSGGSVVVVVVVVVSGGAVDTGTAEPSGVVPGVGGVVTWAASPGTSSGSVTDGPPPTSPPRSVTAPDASSRLSAISFCLRGAVARLTPLKRPSATAVAAPARTIWRGSGSRERRSPAHHAPTRPVRIGVSTYRYDSSVIRAVSTMAMENSASVSGFPATSRIIW